MSEVTWRFKTRGGNTFLAFDETESLLEVESLSVPKHEDYEDEYVSVKCKGVSKQIMCNLGGLDHQNCDVSKSATVGQLSNSKDFVEFFENGQKSGITPSKTLSKAVPFSVMDFCPSSPEEEGFETVLCNIPIPESLEDSGYMEYDISGVSESDVEQREHEKNDIAETRKEDTKKKPKKKISGKKIGEVLFNTDMNAGTIIGEHLPKESSPAWPPNFREAVSAFREMLLLKFGSPDKWTKDNFYSQQSYFTRVLDINKSKRGCGTLFRYFKVSQLSARNWDLANLIMDRIEGGTLNKNKKKRSGPKGRTVYQTSFDCLDKLDVLEQESIINDVLKQYLDGNFEEASDIANSNPRKKLKTSASGIENSADSFAKKLEEKTHELEICKAKNKTLEHDVKLLLTQNEKAHQNHETLRMKFMALEKKKADLEKEFEVLRNDNEFLTTKLMEKEKEIKRFKCTCRAKLEKERSDSKETDQKAKKKNESRSSEEDPIEQYGKKLEQVQDTTRQYEQDLIELENELCFETTESDKTEENTEKSKKKKKKKKKQTMKEVAEEQKDVRSKDSMTDKRSYNEGQLNLHVDGVVAVAYETTFYLGVVRELGERPTIEFLKKVSGSCYKLFKKRPEIEIVDPLFVLGSVDSQESGKDMFIISGLPDIKQKYAEYRAKYFA